jgi:hypothetical protein
MQVIRFLLAGCLAFSLVACGDTNDVKATGDGADATADTGVHPDGAEGDAQPDAQPDSGGSPDTGADSGTSADASDAAACDPVILTDGGGACPAPGGSETGQRRLLPCGVPAPLDLDGGATADGGWARDGGHVFACMTLCNDISSCYLAPVDAGPAAIVTCCP